MFSIRRHLTYANVAATMALVFAMSGGALAASHYLITKPSQLSPKVRKALTGAKGAKGAIGATGSQGKEGTPGKEGPQGREGPQGKEGPLLSTLPSGKTLRGHYHLELDGTKAATLGQGYSYAFPLASTPTTHFIKNGATPPAACPGTAANPAAQPGNLCVYESATHENASVEIAIQSDDFGFGLVLQKESAGTENFWSIGTWAVTAP